MTQLAFAVAGAVIGSFVGAPQLGFAIGSAIGASVAAPDQQGPRLSNLSPPQVEYGWPIRRIYGTPQPLDTWRAWQSDLIEIAHEEGKGGPTSTTYSYKAHCLLLVGEVGPDSLLRVWINKKLVATFRADSPTDSVAASLATDAYDSIVFLNGNADQSPWSVYEAVVGVDSAVAYIGRCTVGIEGLRMEGGTLPAVELEVCNGSAAFASYAAWVYTAEDVTSISAQKAHLGSVTYADLPQFVPYKAIQFATHDDGLGSATTFATEAEALAHAATIAPGAIEVTGTVLRSVGGAGAISSIHNDASETTTYRIYGTRETLPLPGATQIGYYQFTIKLPAPVVRFDVSDPMAGQYALASSSVVLQDLGLSNQPTICFGTSDRPVVAVITNRMVGGVATYYCKIEGVEYNVGVAGNAYRYVLLGTALWISQNTGGTPFRVRRFAIGGATHAAESADLTGTAAVGLACDGTTCYVQHSGGAITRLNASTLASAGADIALAPASEHIFCDAAGDLHAYGSQRVYRWSGSAWAEVLAVTGSSFNGALMLHPPGFEAGVLHATQSTSAASGYVAWQGLVSLPAVTAADTDVNTILAAEFARCGIHAGLIDLTATAGLPVIGYDNIGSARRVVEELSAGYYFDIVSDAKLTTVRRGGASVATIPFGDLGAGIDQAKEEPLEITRANDIEVSPRVALTVYNASADGANLTVYDDRVISESPETTTASLPIVFTPAQAQGIVNTMVADARVAATTFKFAVSDYYAHLRLGDVVTVTARSGSAFRVRLVREAYTLGVREFEAVLDDAGVLQDVGITSTDYSNTLTIASPGGADLIVLDIPMLRDNDRTPGLYLAADLRGAARSASAFRSVDDVSYESVGTITADATVGSAQTVLRAWDGNYVWDRYSSVDVLLTGGTLSSSTEEAMAADRSINAAAIGRPGAWEIVRFRTATLIAADTYRLTNLLRVQRGSETDGGAHRVGDTFVLLNTTALRPVEQSGAEVGTTRYWKGVAPGRRLDSVVSQAEVLECLRAKPIAPTRLVCARDGSFNATLSWSPRTNMGTRYGGTGGSIVPLGDQIASWDIEIYGDSGYVTLAESLSSLTASVAYTAAQQTAAGLTPGNALHVRVYPRSSSVGRGAVLEGSV